jgi:hypothetical protein
MTELNLKKLKLSREISSDIQENLSSCRLKRIISFAFESSVMLSEQTVSSQNC